MDPRHANILPTRVSTPSRARACVALEGAAIVDGITDQTAAIEFGTAMLGERAVRVVPQIEATSANAEHAKAVLADKPVDARGRKRMTGSPDQTLVAHNDGYGFGDYAPDYIMLFCERPCAIGGASFLVDALKLLTIVTEEDPDLADFLWTVPVDHTEPNFPNTHIAPIARVVGGRVQVRHQPYLAPVPGRDEAVHATYIERWMAACEDARHHGPRFRLETGQMAVVDNYRTLHGRGPYVDPERRLISIWGWTTSAVRVPDSILNIVEPESLPVG